MNLNRRNFLTGAGIAAAALLPRVAKAAPIGTFADGIVANLSKYCTGIQVTVMDQAGVSQRRAVGFARMPHNSNPRLMAATDKVNAASVSKVITATAMIRALYDNPSVTLNSHFVNYLPSHWTVHSSLSNVTFKQLLQHTSGFVTKSYTYSALKASIATGVVPGTTGLSIYNPTNYTLMRLLIPRIANYGVPQIPNSVTGQTLAALETSQASQFALYFIDYTQKAVWDKIGIAPDMQCKPTSNNPLLCYRYPDPGQTAGDDFGDQTLQSGSSGWNASSSQLAAFIRTLHETNLILPNNLSEQMKDEKLGYESNGMANSTTSYFNKRGYLPSSQGVVRTLIMGFSNKIYVSVIINSDFVEEDIALRDEVINAFNATTW